MKKRQALVHLNGVIKTMNMALDELLNDKNKQERQLRKDINKSLAEIKSYILFSKPGEIDE